jgi:hypothetical protein
MAYHTSIDTTTTTKSSIETEINAMIEGLKTELIYLKKLLIVLKHRISNHQSPTT